MDFPLILNFKEVNACVTHSGYYMGELSGLFLNAGF